MWWYCNFFFHELVQIERKVNYLKHFISEFPGNDKKIISRCEILLYFCSLNYGFESFNPKYKNTILMISRHFFSRMLIDSQLIIHTYFLIPIFNANLNLEIFKNKTQSFLISKFICIIFLHSRGKMLNVSGGKKQLVVRSVITFGLIVTKLLE